MENGNLYIKEMTLLLVSHLWSTDLTHYIELKAHVFCTIFSLLLSQLTHWMLHSYIFSHCAKIIPGEYLMVF